MLYSISYQYGVSVWRTSTEYQYSVPFELLAIYTCFQFPSQLLLMSLSVPSFNFLPIRNSFPNSTIQLLNTSLEIGVVHAVQILFVVDLICNRNNMINWYWCQRGFKTELRRFRLASLGDRYLKVHLNVDTCLVSAKISKPTQIFKITQKKKL